MNSTVGRGGGGVAGAADGAVGSLWLRKAVVPLAGGLLGGLLMYTIALLQPGVVSDASVPTPLPSVLAPFVAGQSAVVGATPRASAALTVAPSSTVGVAAASPPGTTTVLKPSEGPLTTTASPAKNFPSTPFVGGVSTSSSPTAAAPPPPPPQVPSPSPSPSAPGGGGVQQSVSRGGMRPKTSNECIQAIFDERAGQAIRIATIGDSLSTESQGNAFKKRLGSPAYTATLAKMLGLSQFANTRFAYTGYIATGVYARATEELAEQLKQPEPAFDLCIVLVGTNDWLSVNAVSDFLLGVRRLTALCDRVGRLTILQAIPPWRCMSSAIDHDKAERVRVTANGCLAKMIRADADAEAKSSPSSSNVTCPSGDSVEPLRPLGYALPGTKPGPRLCRQRWLPTTEDMIHPDTPTVEPADVVFLDWASVSAVNRSRVGDPEAHRWFADCVHPSTEGKVRLASYLVRFFDANGLVRNGEATTIGG